MRAPPLPAHEAARLEALRASQILDSPPERSFDDLMELASFICKTPIAAVTLIDSQRQWHKAYKGILGAEIPRSISFCAHAILDPDRVMEVSDAQADKRFADNPLVTGDAHVRFYAGAPLVVEGGHALGALCVLDTEPRHLDEESRKALQAIARQVVTLIEVHRRAAALEVLNRELQAARAEAEAEAEARSRMLAFVSHELRTPMNGVMGMASLLLSTAMVPEQREMAETIRASSQQLLYLLNQLLDFSRIEATNDNVELKPTDVLAVVDEVFGLLDEQARARGLQLLALVHPSLPPRVLSSAGLLRQILVNLVGNAIKFSSAGEVQVTLGPLGADRRLRITVSDQGPGIPAPHMTRLFQPFYRIEGAQHQAPGTGLGLAICRRLVQRLGGQIWAENNAKGGASFVFTLHAETVVSEEARPLCGRKVLVLVSSPVLRRALLSRLRWWGAEVEAPAEGAPLPGTSFEVVVAEGKAPAALAGAPLVVEVGEGKKGAHWGRLFLKLNRSSVALPASGEVASGFDASLAQQMPMRLLLVEDNPVNQRVALKTLERFGYRVDVVSDGQQALEVIAAMPYDVVLMDVHMPRLDGFEATRVLRANGVKVWIIAMTAGAFESDREACLEAGMDDYLSKPFLVPDLVAVLRRAYLVVKERSEKSAEANREVLRVVEAPQPESTGRE